MKNLQQIVDRLKQYNEMWRKTAEEYPESNMQLARIRGYIDALHWVMLSRDRGD